MEVSLTRDQESFIRRAIESGRFQRQEDAVREALSFWEERERKRAEFLATVDDARASLARGEGLTITQESVRQRGCEEAWSRPPHCGTASRQLMAKSVANVMLKTG